MLRAGSTPATRAGTRPQPAKRASPHAPNPFVLQEKDGTGETLNSLYI